MARGMAGKMSAFRVSELFSTGFGAGFGFGAENRGALSVESYVTDDASRLRLQQSGAWFTIQRLLLISIPPRPFLPAYRINATMAQHKHIINIISKQVIPPLSSKLHKGQAGESLASEVCRETHVDS
jgi:hypothetical protein